MNQEIELKFQISESAIKSLSRFLQTQDLVEKHSLQLTNTYYDSLDNLLRNHRSSLRIRGTCELGKSTEYEITVKSAGKALAGLHARQEHNVRLPNNRLDLSVLPPHVFGEGLDKDVLAKNLVAQFSTNFERQTWLINYNQSQIEVALDQGKIVADKLMQPIIEVELELKTGYQLDLLLLALELSKFNLHLFSQSKAARGYRLLQGNHLSPIASLAADNISIADILQFWQTNEEYALVYNNLSLYRETLRSVANNLQYVLPAAQNEYSSKINQVYCAWLKNLEYLCDVKTFAFSEINTQLKLYLLLMDK